jgi:sugar phosphate isomerase/epimerase
VVKPDTFQSFGIVQGRLIKPPGNELQWFPQEEWQREFELASQVGLNYIELIAERQHNANNPIWNDYGIEIIKKLVKINKLHLHTFCNDYIIDHCLIKNTKAIEQTLNLISKGKKLGLEKLIIPLFENSELTFYNYKTFKSPLLEIANAAKENDISICLETILNGEQLLDVLKSFDHPNIYCVFDTGNQIFFKHNIYSDILLLRDYIKHVHIKDKTKQDENVLLGTGIVNFHKVFKSLYEINYNGPYTFETTRGSNPIETAKYNLSFAKYFISDNLRD